MNEVMAGLGLAALAALAADGGGARIDHVILGVSSLEAGVRELQEKTGVEPAFGGEHPGLGSQNSLASLGSGVYLEILAPVPDKELAPHLAQVKGYPTLTPMGWAVTVDDIEAKARQLTALGYQTTGVSKGSRERPDGSRLEWALVVILDARGWQLPFFIQWSATSPHPSTTSPAGCKLASFAVLDPEPAPLAQRLQAMGAAVAVAKAAAPGFKVTLSCPKGEVTFGPGN